MFIFQNFFCSFKFQTNFSYLILIFLVSPPKLTTSDAELKSCLFKKYVLIKKNPLIFLFLPFILTCVESGPEVTAAY